MPVLLQESIISHLTALEEEFKHCFPEVSDNELNIVPIPFRRSVDSLPQVHVNELIVLPNDSTAKDLFDHKTVENFWIQMIGSSANVAKAALRLLLPLFRHTYVSMASQQRLLSKLHEKTILKWRIA